VPSPVTFDIKAASQADPSKSATLSVTISGTVENTMPVSVNFGPNGYTGVGSAYYNGIFATVKVCEPGTTTCATVPNVILDTGSTGLRVLSTTISGLTLPQVDFGSGDKLYECQEFADLSYTWGPVAMATLQLGGETASQVPAASGGTANAGIPIQIITAGATAPAIAASTDDGGPSSNSVSILGANGILGVGNAPQDCGVYCASVPSSYSGWQYFACSGATCENAAPIALSAQLWNPIAAFSSGDTNGSILTLPEISATGAATAQGTMTFGIGTQANNAVPSGATYFGLDDYENFQSATYHGVTYTSTNSWGSYIDSGSSAFWILDPTTLSNASGVDVTNCEDNPFYCVSPSPLTLDITVTGSNNTSADIMVNIVDADSLINSADAAYDDIGGYSGDSMSTDYIAFGLPFFFGRSIFVGIADPSGTYPNGYWIF
jgi:hypothetical protein